MSTNAHLFEVFSSIQGEGMYIGERQVFIRFCGCNLACDYCDTPDARSMAKEYRVEQTPGKHDFKQFPNPVSSEEVLSHITPLFKPKAAIHSVCLTGGEPLLQVDFLKGFLPAFKQLEMKVFLETNGTLPKHLEEIIGAVDIISADIKIPSSGCAANLRESKIFLEVAYTKSLFAKIVVVPDTTAKEIDDAAQMISEIDGDIPLVLQPATPTKTIKHRPHPDSLMALHAIAKRKLKTVRVIPQVHKMLGLL